jgi:hypothetical protein
VEVAEARRDELEWKLRVEIAKIRDAELDQRRAADGLRRIEQSLAGLLIDDEDPTEVRSAVTTRGNQAGSGRPQAPVAPSSRAVPPPLPPIGAVAPRGSHAETFQRAMAGRKRYSA